MRRDSSDHEWAKVKRVVTKRDKTCRFCRLLNYFDLQKLKSNAGPMVKVLDHAHYLSVSNRPDLCYNPNNIVLLNRFSHSMLDDLKNPITGKSITVEEQDLWWRRILSNNKEQWNALKEIGVVEDEHSNTEVK